MWRRTPQTTLILELLAANGHATNQELAVGARKAFPNLTNTTVHRITARLVGAGMVRYAPNIDNLKMLDSNISPHDHFYCQGCKHLVDVMIEEPVLQALEQQLPGKLSRRNVLISGTCEKCEIINV